MMTSLTVENWKSFEKATLYIDALTVLIGTNASGKSNLLEALVFLSRIASGTMLTAALQGDGRLPPVRGGIDLAVHKPGNKFAISLIYRVDETLDYDYRIECLVGHLHCSVSTERLDRISFDSDPSGNRISATGVTDRRFTAAGTADPLSNMVVNLNSADPGVYRHFNTSFCALFQMATMPADSEIVGDSLKIVECLTNIFILDPIPSHMRGFSALSDRLEPDACNIAGVIAALPAEPRRGIERTLTDYAAKLPERDITRVFSETVGILATDAMLYCEEQFSANGASAIVDARGLSDGTLRFLGILTALLTRPAGSLLVIEEVDNGLHPSRSQLLLEMLRQIGGRRGLDIVVTTHNSALLDAMSTSMIPFIAVAHRDPETGASCLTLLEDIVQLPKLLAQGPVGRLSSQGLIERALKTHTGQAA